MTPKFTAHLEPEIVLNKRLLFVTGKLASSAVTEAVSELAMKYRFQYEVIVLPISVAALMTGRWLLKNLSLQSRFDFIVIPGYLQDDFDLVQSNLDTKIVIGPKDIRDLAVLFGSSIDRSDYGARGIEIIAEINHADRLGLSNLIDQATRLTTDGADRIDLGCSPNSRWTDVGKAVGALTKKNIKTSIDTFDIWEAAEATAHGSSLVLSVNSSNREASVDWGAEVVVVPDMDKDWLVSISQTVDFLQKANVSFRIDPILDPIGCGFAASLDRYRTIRKEFSSVGTLMGIGNITELTDVDSAGINVVLLAFCEEIGISSVLTTQVINWCRSSVAECNIASQLVHYAVQRNLPPKRVDSRLVILRDDRLPVFSAESIATLAGNIRDNNYRILIDREQIHLISASVHIRGSDPFLMMDELMALPASENVDPSHAFYLGFELSKAATALQLGKRYEQDQALAWGMLSKSETHHRLKRTYRRKK